MCGIAGFYLNKKSEINEISVLKKMIVQLAHRGPDEYGLFNDGMVGLAQARLSIIDLKGGSQPIHNENKTIWIVFNGEIFNYIELREDLEKKGHVFYTKTDTEVLVHLYEEYDTKMVHYLNGQFAFTIYDINKKRLFMARDHVGIVPLFFTRPQQDTLIFASEIKSLLSYPGIQKEFDYSHLQEIYTFWANIPGHTPFKGINELRPGYFLVFENNSLKEEQYWNIQFPGSGEFQYHPTEYYERELYQHLDDASAIRLRADVPVASYLSGGIDSSIVAFLIKKFHVNDLITFSVGFEDKHFDERYYQKLMIKQLQTQHHEVVVDYEKIAEAFDKIVRYMERPTFRTAPAPLYYLSQLVKDNGIKVVLTGEGADENFAGYNIFKEAKIRHFLAHKPGSEMREKLLFELYPYVKKDKRTMAFWAAFFKKNLNQADSLVFSHLLRWGNGLFTTQFLREEIKNQFHFDEKIEEIESLFPKEARKWHPLNKAQYIEMKLFLPGYLLSSQGDRMLMGNSVEGRFPYLDKRVMEFAAQMPNYLKMPGLKEKNILKRTFAKELPHEIVYRDKQPYRAPIYECFIGEKAPDYIQYVMDRSQINRFGIFKEEEVGKLMQKARKKGLTEKEEMALMNIISTQILYDQFIEAFDVDYHQATPIIKIYK